MEAILAKLLVPDSAVIAEGTKELKQVFKTPAAVPELCAVLTTSQSTQVRQYAALILKKKLGKTRTWSKMPVEVKTAAKETFLRALLLEKEKPVRMAVAQLVGTLAKHELKAQAWPQLGEFLQECFGSTEAPNRLLGIYTLSVLCETSGEFIKPMLGHFGKVFQRALTQEENLEIPYYAVVALTHLVQFIGSDEMGAFQPLVGHVISAIQRLVVAREEEMAVIAMDIFDELFEIEVAIVVPQTKPIIELCLKIAADENNELEDSIRVKAIAILGRIARLKKKTILKHKLYVPMLAVLIPVMSKLTEEEEEQAEAGSAITGIQGDDDLQESNSPIVCACQTVDVLAVCLPPAKFMPVLLSHVQPAIESGDPSRMKGAFNALAVCAEGCSEHIRTKYLSSFLQVVGNGIKHQHPAVRNAALYALGQFSEYLQPDISKYAGDILPVLAQHLQQAQEELRKRPGLKTLPGLDRIFYALEIFVENLEDKLVPYLPPLMNHFLLLLEGDSSVHVRQLSISAIGSCCNAVKAAIVPFFDPILKHCHSMIAVCDAEKENKDAQVLLCQSLDTLGSLARAVGPTNFVPNLAADCCRLGLELVEKYDDPDVRKCTYALFASVAFVVKEEMHVVLPRISELMIHALESREGISFQTKDDETNSDLPLEELSEDDDEISLGTDDTNDDDDDVIKAVSVENAYMEEKEQALVSLKELCKYCKTAFLPYLLKSMEETWKLLDFPDEDVRKASLEALAEFAIAYYQQGDEVAFAKASGNLIAKLCSVVAEDTDVGVVCSALEQLAYVLKECKTGITGVGGHPELIIQSVHKVMKGECICMNLDPNDSREDAVRGDDDSEANEAEEDEILFEYAGEVIPALGTAMSSSAAFAPYFAGLLPHLLKKTKKHCNVSERSFGAGSLAECMEPLKGSLAPFLTALMPVYTALMKDEDDDVRNNAVFGLGELMLHAGEVAHAHFANVLQILSALLAHEENGRVIDQIVAAVCRLVIANADLVPVKEVLPVVFQHLPLKEDTSEYVSVFKCFLVLCTRGEELMKTNMGKILHLAGTLYKSDIESAEESEKLILDLVRGFYASFRSEFDQTASQLPEEVASKIAVIVSS